MPITKVKEGRYSGLESCQQRNFQSSVAVSPRAGWQADGLDRTEIQ